MYSHSKETSGCLERGCGRVMRGRLAKRQGNLLEVTGVLLMAIVSRGCTYVEVVHPKPAQLLARQRRSAKLFKKVRAGHTE